MYKEGERQNLVNKIPRCAERDRERDTHTQEFVRKIPIKKRERK